MSDDAKTVPPRPLPPPRALPPTRVLSGIQPTGRFHWGNYFGAIRQYIELQSVGESYYFIADLHALTTVREPERLRAFVRDAALDLVALGLDPVHAALFVQSDVPEVTELTWLLMTVTPMGLLERCHAFKDKKSRGMAADAGLFTYPVLMSADILAYDATVVPVGEDQVQHIEVCRDLAGTFNHLYGEVFTLPKPRLVEAGARVPGTDGQKMSKSYENTIEVFEEPGAQKKKIMRITTDSRPLEEPKEPEGDHLFDLFSLFAPAAEREAMAALYRRGGFGYGDVKKALVAAAADFFADARRRRAELAADPGTIDAILAQGAERARAKAGDVLNYRLLSIRNASSGRFDRSGIWELNQVTETRFKEAKNQDPLDAVYSAATKTYPTLKLMSEVTPQILEVLLLNPEKMSIYSLGRFIDHLTDNKQDTQRHSIAYWKKLVYPFIIFVMLALALPFAYLRVRSGSVGIKVFGGIMLGMSFQLFNSLFSNVGLLGSWPAMLTAFIPPLFYFGLALFALQRVSRA